MKNLHTLDLNRLCDEEVIKRFGGPGNASCGAFSFNSCIDKAPMVCMAASDTHYEFVSVRRKNRSPNWPEMEQVRKLFFEDTEIIMQFHAPCRLAPFVLFMWHPLFDLPFLPPIPGWVTL